MAEDSAFDSWLKKHNLHVPTSGADAKVEVQQLWEEQKAKFGGKDDDLTWEHIKKAAQEKGGEAWESVKKFGHDAGPQTTSVVKQIGSFFRSNITTIGGGVAGLLVSLAVNAEGWLPLALIVGGTLVGKVVDGALNAPKETPAPDGAGESKNKSKAGGKDRELSKDEVTTLQNTLNSYSDLAHKGEKHLKLTGEMDADTKKRWLEFKQDVFSDGAIISKGYVAHLAGEKSDDPAKINAAFEAKLKELKVDPANYDMKHPPKQVIEFIQDKLHVEKTGQLDEATKAAVKKEKNENWIDDRVNDGALEKLSSTVQALQKASEERNRAPGHNRGQDGPPPPPIPSQGRDR